MLHATVIFPQGHIGFTGYLDATSGILPFVGRTYAEVEAFEAAKVTEPRRCTCGEIHDAKAFVNNAGVIYTREVDACLRCGFLTPSMLEQTVDGFGYSQPEFVESRWLATGIIPLRIGSTPGNYLALTCGHHKIKAVPGWKGGCSCATCAVDDTCQIEPMSDFIKAKYGVRRFFCLEWQPNVEIVSILQGDHNVK